MDSIYESIVSTIDQDYQSKKDMSLSSFTKKELSKSIIDKYKSDYRQLSHIRINKNTKGYVWLDGNSLVGFINVEDKDGEKWINSFEIFGKYKKHGLSKQMMNVAMRDLKATHLSVNKKNNVAIKIYKSIGFNTYKETDTMLFMSINESYIEESKTSKRLYHVSQSNLDGKTIQPSVPNNFMTKNGYEDGKTKRVCFSSFIDGCLRALSQKCTGMKLYVHIPDGEYDVYKPSVKEVPDVKITKEVWIKEPVKLKCIGKIDVIGDRGEDGLPYKYGNNTAELYDWDWKWVERVNESYIEESIKTKNQIGNKETKDIQTVISSLDDGSFNDFKFKDIVYCDIRYKSGKPIAFITIRTKLVSNSTTVGYVSLAVDPKYQKQGIGKSLTEKAVSWFKQERGIHFLEWHCLQDNEASRKLANSAGFREYIAKSEDEYAKFTMESYVEEKLNLLKKLDEEKVSKEILDTIKPIILTSQNKSKASKLSLDLKCEVTEVDSGMVFILVLDGPQDKRDTEEAKSLLKDLASKCKLELSDIVSKIDIGDGDEGCLFFTMDKGKIRRKRKDLLESYAIDIKESDIDTKSIVFFTKNITPESLLKLYQFMTNPSHGINPLHGNIGVKISTGEYGSHNFLSPLLIKDLVSYLHGVIVECNTAYVGKRNTTEDHWKTIKAHGFLNIANCDIMDEEGDFPLPVKDPYHIEKNYVGDHLKRYDSILMLSHFKGHAMAGYGGALKNMSIGMASSRGKLHIHTAGEGGDMMKADRNKFLESMVDADMSVMDYMGKENILYINIANNLSIDCDCDTHPKDPYISDIGIFASTDPVALDQACIDAVYNHPEEKKRNLINRITSRNGTHTIDCAYEKGLGNKHYVILDIDQVIEEASIEEEIENEFSPTSFVKRSSLPAKNQKSHTQYLKRKTHSNKTNNATAQHELPKYNQIGELYVEEVTKSVRVKPVFIVTSYTNTPFGKAIKTFTHSEYTHAAISFDTSLEELYSFNADPKYNSDRYKGGISRESLSSYIESYDKTIIQVNCIFLKPSDFDIVKNTLNDLLENAEKTKYDYGNIINILIGKVKDTGMAMVCSQFVAYILHTAGIRLLDKSDNIVTPKDLSTITNPKVYKIFEGYAKDYEKKRIDRIFRKLKTKALLIKESLLELCV